jgi:hypothetical protein
VDLGSKTVEVGAVALEGMGRAAAARPDTSGKAGACSVIWISHEREEASERMRSGRRGQKMGSD